MGFEWDPVKSAANLIKHGLSFDTAVTVFADPRRFELESTKPEYGEVRWKVVGMVAGRVLTVVYTLRDERIRIISARSAQRDERRIYSERTAEA